MKSDRTPDSAHLQRSSTLLDGIKLMRNVVAERLYRLRRPGELSAFIESNAHLRGQTVAFAVAFNTPWVIDVLLRTAHLNLPGTRLLVADNSTDPAAREQIRQICGARGVPYLRLPSSPVRHFSRSHGVALTWIYYNIVLQLRPGVFAFIDHDLFPLKPVRLAERVQRQPVYGRSARGRGAWSIWAGYCVFDFDAVSAYQLDFNTDRPRGLDTGGRNWARLFRHLDESQIRLTDLRNVSAVDEATGRPVALEIIDEFVHVRHASFSEGPEGAPGREYYENLTKRLESGRNVADVILGADTR